MLICGIHDGHNAAAALVRDGRLLGALQEERPTRIKNFHGFPVKAIGLLLAESGAGWNDVDAYVFAGREYYFPPGSGPGDRSAQVRSYKSNLGVYPAIKRMLRHTPMRDMVQGRRQRFRTTELTSRGVHLKKVFAVDHHRCHAATAFYGRRPDPDALIVTLDGAGDGRCATISVPTSAGGIKTLASISEEHSIGTLWALVTSLMGMVPMEHEYKMMGMAPYAKGESASSLANLFRQGFHMTNGTWARAGASPEASYSYRYWRERLEFCRFDHICSGLQMFTEEWISEWVQFWLQKTGRSKVCLSGGVFMNVKLNKAIAELPEVDDLYVFPSCGDETNAIGAAWAKMADDGMIDKIAPIGPLYLGPEPTTNEYNDAAMQARREGFHVIHPTDCVAVTAELLASGQVVARFDGKEEFGARALGNRSILADPSKQHIVKEINQAIKCRDFWMPFACSILEENGNEYIVNPKGLEAPYMILTFDSKRTEEIVAGSHPEDGTVRPQLVKRAWNPSYHRLIELFAAKTGRSAVLNTSFNIHGEPIVSRPTEAVDVLRRSGLRFLSLGSFLVSKQEISTETTERCDSQVLAQHL